MTAAAAETPTTTGFVMVISLPTSSLPIRQHSIGVTSVDANRDALSRKVIRSLPVHSFLSVQGGWEQGAVYHIGGK